MRAPQAKETKVTRFHAAIPLVAAAAAVFVAVGCDDNGGEAQLQAASQTVEETRAEVEAAAVAVQEKSEAAQLAHDQLVAAEQALAEAQQRLAEAEGIVAGLSTDDLLFRSVQRRLLDELEDVAIDASVDGAVVTLRGRVPDPSQRDFAVDIARQTPGVVSVRDRIVVTTPDVAVEE